MRTLRKITGIMITFAIMTVMLAGCGGNAATINMATKPMTEQYILGSMMKTLIEQDTDLTVHVTTGVGGGTSNIPQWKKAILIFIPNIQVQRGMPY